ncbi:hypothetical protein ABPG74_015480 [Tetrahymena malaccensis]
MGCGATKVRNFVKNVLVLDATEQISKATVHELKKLNIQVTAGVSDLNSKEAHEYIKNRIKVTQIDLNSEDDILTAKMKNFEAVYLTIPQNVGSLSFIFNIIKAVQSSGVSYLLISSNFNLDLSASLSKQFQEVEEQIKLMNISYGFMRFPILIEDILSNSDSIKNNGILYGPIEGSLQFNIITAKDAAQASASVLTNYTNFINKTLKVASDKKSYDQLAQEFSNLLNKSVKYSKIGQQEIKKQIIDSGLTKEQAEIIIENFSTIKNKDIKLSTLTSTYKKITRCNPTATNQWIKLNIDRFIVKQEKQQILVLGASGQIGQATVKSLLTKKANVTAGTRNPEKIKNLQDLGASILKVDMAQDQLELTQKLKDYNILFIVTPGHVNRSYLSINTIQAAQKAKVEYILIVSVPSVNHPETIFGGQFIQIEKELKSCGINYCILRLPLFTDNFLSHTQSIISQNSFYGPQNNRTKYATVTVEDASNAASQILIDYKNHIKKEYKIVSDLQSVEEQCKSFSLVLGRTINYIQTKYEDTKKQLSQFLPDWQVDGILELYKLADQQDLSQTSLTNHYNWITQNNPTTNEQWIKNNIQKFQQSS